MKHELTPKQKRYLCFKRAADIFFSIVLLLILIPLVWWWAAIVIKLTSRGPVLFKQERVGKDGKPFRVLKFRSMRVETDPNMTAKAAGDAFAYTYPFGTFLRKSSLDETPQILNILKGEMSFIGPRPLIDKGVDSITINIRKENGAIALRPGMSGLAQIQGRAQLPEDIKGHIDGEYFEKISCKMDTKIFFSTVAKVLQGFRKPKKKK